MKIDLLMPSIGLVLVIGVLPHIVMRLWLRARFIAFGVRFSGSYNKRKKKYLKLWNWKQRLFLVPFLGRNSAKKYRIQAIFLIVHFVLTVSYLFVAFFQVQLLVIALAIILSTLFVFQIIFEVLYHI